MDDLMTWLRAQLDDDERVAKAAPGTRWIDSEDGWVMNEDMHMLEGDLTAAAHAARHDPARVLAEVDAKRKRLTVIELDLADDPTDETAQYLLRLELLPYADRPGYRDEWKP